MKPIRALMWCPKCGLQHIDEGEWATREHKTHRCVGEGGCRHEWRPAEVPTVGVEKLERLNITFSGVKQPGYIITEELVA